MKISKILSYLAQFVKYLVSLITGAEKTITSAIDALGKSNSADVGKVAQAVADTAEAQEKNANTRQANLVEQVGNLQKKFDDFAMPESDEEIRKAVEPFLPEELAKDFKW